MNTVESVTRWRPPALVLALVVLCAPVLGHADQLAEIKARGVLKVVIKNEGNLSRVEHNDPAHFQKRNFEMELARAIATHIVGSPEKIEFITFKRRERLPAVSNGIADLGISMFAINADDQREVDFSQPYFASGLAVLQHGKSPINGLADLRGLKLVALNEKQHDPGEALAKLAAAQGIRFDLERVDRFQDGVDEVLAGTRDGMVAEATNLDVYRSEHGGLSRSVLLSQESFAVAVPKQQPALLAAVNRVIQQLKQSGQLDAMLARHKLPKSVGVTETSALITTSH